jgi:hypothetical protein
MTQCVLWRRDLMRVCRVYSERFGDSDQHTLESLFWLKQFSEKMHAAAKAQVRDLAWLLCSCSVWSWWVT